MKYSQHHERGVALIATLCLIFTAGVLVGALVIIAQLNTFNIGASAAVFRSKYVSEGCLNRIQYLIEADFELFEQDDRTETDYDEYDHERFLPDAVEREIDYYGINVKYRIVNGTAGLPMHQNQHRRSLNMLSSITGSTTLNDKITVLSNRINDYTDSDDNPGTDGLERGDYEEVTMNHLPRNGQIEFREELRWIPEVNDILPVDANGRFSFVRLPAISGNYNPDLYTVSWSLLRIYGGLDERQAADVMAALNEWRKSRIPVSEQIDPLLWGTLLTRFSIAPSDYYTVLIEHAAGENAPTSRLAATFTASGVSGPADGVIRYLEWLRF